MIAKRQIVAYCRVSTDRQGEEGVSLDAQLHKIRAWAVVHDAELLEGNVFVEIKSGKSSANRPQLQAAIARAIELAAAMVVCKLDRFARSTKDALSMAERLRQGKADLVVLDSPIDTTAPHGRLIFTILAALAEFERDIIARRTQEALDYKRGRGEALGNTPFGWARDAEGKLVMEPREQDVIGAILRLRLIGRNAADIKRTLESLDLRPRDAGWTKRHVRLARAGSIILTGPAMEGFQRIQGENPDASPAELAKLLRASGVAAPATKWSRAQISAIIAGNSPATSGPPTAHGAASCTSSSSKYVAASPRPPAPPTVSTSSSSTGTTLAAATSSNSPPPSSKPSLQNLLIASTPPTHFGPSSGRTITAGNAPVGATNAA